jgi:hypothetical protein
VERYNSPYINHFLQPDTITPGGPQGLNRFSYGLNNPSTYTDPSGHKACGAIDKDGKCDDSEEKLNKLIDFVQKKILNDKGDKIKNEYTSLEAMGKVLERAAYIYGRDWNGFLDSTTYVFTGYYGHGSGAMWGAHKSDFSGYFDGDSGFNQGFQDGSNQVRHFWAAFATAANPSGHNPLGAASANLGNWWHDIATDGFGNDGATIKDYELSITGIDIAGQVGNEIKTPFDLAGIILDRLGTDGPGYTGPWLNPHWWITPNN